MHMQSWYLSSASGSEVIHIHMHMYAYMDMYTYIYAPEQRSGSEVIHAEELCHRHL